MKKRIDELDMVKGIGIIYVFLRHLCELTGVHAYGAEVYAVFNSCTEAIMFLFVFLSGYVFKSKGSVSLDIRNKVKQLLVPYLLYSALFLATYFIRYVLLGEMSLPLFGTYTLSNLLANPGFDYIHWTACVNPLRYAFVPYWYIAEIFTAFILFILVYRLLEHKGLALKGLAVVGMLLLGWGLMCLDLREILAKTFVSGVSYFTVGPNIIGFAALLLIGNILQELKAFDVEAHSRKAVMGILAVSLAIALAYLVLHDNPYALQYAKWGQDSFRSLRSTTVSAFSLTYCLVYLCYYLKRFAALKSCLSYLGANTLDILLLHFGVAELLCMVFGFWYPVYDIPCYPAAGFAWWHFYLVVVLTAVVIGLFFATKSRLKQYVNFNG